MHQNQVSQVFPHCEIEYQGRKFMLYPPTWETEGLYCAYLEDSVIEGAMRVFARARGLPQGFAVKVMAEDTSNIGLHLYDWNGEKWRESLGVTRNLKQLAMLTFAQKQDDGSVANQDFLDPEDAKNLIDGIWDEPLSHAYAVMQLGEERWVRTLGDKIIHALTEYINRPNSRRPAAQDKPLAS